MKEAIRKDILALLPGFGVTQDIPLFSVEEPKSAAFGEYTSNVAMVLARYVKKSPLVLAQEIAEQLPQEDYQVIAVAPGYLNFVLVDQVLLDTIVQCSDQGAQYGTPVVGQAQKINNEFISANPTGPLHFGNGRGGYFGDSLTRLLRKMGNEVTSEYYVNDGGEQITKLGQSVLKTPEAVYGGEYIDELHARIGQNSQSVEVVGREAAHILLTESIQKTVKENMHITFDVWTSERALLESGIVERALKTLQNNGYTYEAEGALWLRTTDFGDDKDRVLKKNDGSYTYFASDAGHILFYIENGVEVILETFGADHHGYTKRFESVARMLGFTGSIHFTLVQLVQLEKDGSPVRMSKRAGNVVTIDEVVERVGPDVARFFFLMYSPDTHMTFDLGLAEERSQKNPVFYVQYAHARMASILSKAETLGFEGKVGQSFTHAKERELARALYFFPEFLARAAAEYAPHRLTQFALSLADTFHSFYGAAQVLNEEAKEQSEHRLALVAATKAVLGETLRLIGVSAPEKM